MNVERLTKLAEWLENGAPHENITFDMTTTIKFKVFNPEDEHETARCGTVCCIAGAAVQFFHEDFEHFVWCGIRRGYVTGDANEDEYSWSLVSDEAMRLLDLPDGTAKRLFAPSFGAELIRFSDPAWAARTIRHLIATGEVDWQATRQ